MVLLWDQLGWPLPGPSDDLKAELGPRHYPSAEKGLMVQEAFTQSRTRSLSPRQTGHTLKNRCEEKAPAQGPGVLGVQQELGCEGGVVS